MIKMPLVVIKDLHPIEISAEEWEIILQKREKDKHKSRQIELAEQLSALLTQIKAEGFTVANTACTNYTKAKPWGDASNKWIQLVP